MSSNEIDELKRILQAIQEEQILSTFDTVLLLLLPVTTFLLSATSLFFSISRLLALVSTIFAFVFVSVLVFLVYGKLNGSDRIRMAAWFLFFPCSAAVIVFFTSVWILTLLVGELVTIDAGFVPVFIGGGTVVSIGISYRPTRWMKRTMEKRLPMRAAEIEGVYIELWKKLDASVRFPDLLLFLSGTGALLWFARMGVYGVSSDLFEAMNILILACLGSAVIVIATRRVSLKRLRRAAILRRGNHDRSRNIH